MLLCADRALLSIESRLDKAINAKTAARCTSCNHILKEKCDVCRSQKRGCHCTRFGNLSVMWQLLDIQCLSLLQMKKLMPDVPSTLEGLSVAGQLLTHDELRKRASEQLAKGTPKRLSPEQDEELVQYWASATEVHTLRRLHPKAAFTCLSLCDFASHDAISQARINRTLGDESRADEKQTNPSGYV